MRIGVPKERVALETRVAATPKTVEQLLKLGFSVAVERDAGKLASFDDEAFIAAGASVVDTADVWESDVILKVNAPQDDEIERLRPGTTLISFIWPAQNPQLLENWPRKRYRDGDGFRTAHLPRAVSGCLKLDGKHCRLSRDCRSRP